MCGRFYVPADDPELMSLITEANRRAPAMHLPLAAAGECSPGCTVAVMATGQSGQARVFPMHWGYRLDQRLIFNARSETAAQRPLFRDGFMQRRCLIPAAGYFEWDHREQKPSKYFFGGDGKRIWLAALYRREEASFSCTILTREPTPQLAAFHDRMPVILSESDHAAWLDPKADAAAILQHARLDIIYHKA